MTSRRSQQRVVRKCELSVESLGLRIAPSSFTPSYVFQMPSAGANYVINGQKPGSEGSYGTSTQTFQPFYVINGQKPVSLGSNGSSSQTFQPFYVINGQKPGSEGNTGGSGLTFHPFF